MFENLTERLERSFRQLSGKGKITDINVAETLREVRLALVEADVNYQVAKDFVERVKQQAEGSQVLKSVEPGQQMVKIVHDELVHLMGDTAAPLSLAGSPTVILVAGLQGSGKTTFCGKLALHLKRKHKQRPLLVAGDVYRPAAIDQLQVVGEQVNATVYAEPGNTDVVAVAQHGVEKARKEGFSVVIVDTAGRLAIDEEMMDEVGRVKAAISPQEVLFVVDAMTGQDAVNTAKAFHDVLDFHGVVLTKLDGDTRGGAALSIRSVVNKPIKFVGTGEKMEALDVFHPERMASRILGMGDIVSFVERAQEQYDEEQARKLERKLRRNQFDFNDFLNQLHQLKRMGNLKDLLGMIPGINKGIKDIDISDDSFKGVEAIIYSMTPFERENPKEINASRRERIAAGSGTSVPEVNQLLKQFNQMQRLMKRFNKSGTLDPQGRGGRVSRATKRKKRKKRR